MHAYLIKRHGNDYQSTDVRDQINNKASKDLFT